MIQASPKNCGALEIARRSRITMRPAEKKKIFSTDFVEKKKARRLSREFRANRHESLRSRMLTANIFLRRKKSGSGEKAAPGERSAGVYASPTAGLFMPAVFIAGYKSGAARYGLGERASSLSSASSAPSTCVLLYLYTALPLPARAAYRLRPKYRALPHGDVRIQMTRGKNSTG